jgi:hypothetical protein
MKRKVWSYSDTGDIQEVSGVATDAPKLEDLRQKLVSIHTAYAAAKGRVERSDSTKRRAIIEALDAVVAFLKANDIPTELVRKPSRAFADIENGVSVSYCSNRKNKRGPIPDTTNIKIMRDRAVAEVASLVKRGFYEPDQAIKSVARKIPGNSPLYRGNSAEGGAKTVKGWYDKWCQAQKAAAKRKPK